MLRGSRVQIRVPQRGDKRELHETVTRNAKEEFIRHRLRRGGDHNARSRALTELQDCLGLPEAPLRIECYDMAHLQGTRLRRLDGGGRGRAAEQARVPPVQGQGRARQRRLRRDGGGADPPPDRVPRRARPTARPSSGERPGEVRLPAAAAARRRRQGPARRGRAGRRDRSASSTRSRSPRWPSGSRRSTCPGAASRSTCRGAARRCSCCSGSATRPTASPTRSTASCAASG